MDIPTLFLGSGFGLLIALLAWGNQMREPRKEIRNLENECRQWLRLNKEEITPLIREGKYTTTDRMKSLMTLMGKRTINRSSQLVTIKKIEDLNKEWIKLDKLYKRRYQFSVFLMLVLFIFGGISLYTDTFFINLAEKQFSVNRLYFFPIVLIFLIILYNLIKTHLKEERFVIGILDAWDLIGGS